MHTSFTSFFYWMHIVIPTGFSHVFWAKRGYPHFHRPYYGSKRERKKFKTVCGFEIKATPIVVVDVEFDRVNFIFISNRPMVILVRMGIITRSDRTNPYQTKEYVLKEVFHLTIQKSLHPKDMTQTSSKPEVYIQREIHCTSASFLNQVSCFLA